uniref:Uncharacterized protein n=1 Tax=Triticum urartu TaxID=4572 RepID=A0A8R7QXE7_TRIUA
MRAEATITASRSRVPSRMVFDRLFKRDSMFGRHATNFLLGSSSMTIGWNPVGLGVSHG